MTSAYFTDVAGVAEIPEIDDADLANTLKAAKKAYKRLLKNRADDGGKLEKIEKYLRNEMEGPYIPDTADSEYRLLAERSVTNWIRPALNAPVQCLFIEGHRLRDDFDPSPAWKGWQRNRMDARQSEIFRHALAYGTAFVGVDLAPRGPGKGLARTLIWSSLSTIGLYEDPVNDPRPAFLLHVSEWPESDELGQAILVDREYWHEASFDNGGETWTITKSTLHGCSDTPVVAYTPWRDLSGRPLGLLAPLVPIQDRINQTQFDLLIAQTYTSFVVRYATGMVPPTKRKLVPITVGRVRADDDLLGMDENDPRIADGVADDVIVGFESVEVLDTDGHPMPEKVTTGATRFMVFQDKDTTVGQLDAADLSGFVASQDMNIQHFAAIAQLPPHYLLGKMENLAADALAVAESSLWRMVNEFQHSFGESTEQLMQLIAEIDGLDGATDFDSEVIWRDTGSKSLAQTVDALGKAAQLLGIPGEALWDRIPGTSAGDIKRWKELAEQKQAEFNASAQQNFNRGVSPANQNFNPNQQRVILPRSDESLGSSQ